jgi:hypothetical protein
MDHTTPGAGTSGLACEVCGRLPHPRKLRLTLAKLTAVFPIELLLHALVIHFHTSYALTVTILVITTTVLVIWVVEPLAMRLLTRWLHAPAVHARGRLHEAESLWRIRVTLDDEPGSLEAITHELTALRATILDLQVYLLADGARDEIVVGAAEHLREEDFVRAIQRGGGVDVHVWQTTALALVDGQTKALTLAARVAVTPEELSLAVAEMLEAHVVTDHLWLTRSRSPRGLTTEPPCGSLRRGADCSSSPHPMNRSPGRVCASQQTRADSRGRPDHPGILRDSTNPPCAHSPVTGSACRHAAESSTVCTPKRFLEGADGLWRSARGRCRRT